MSDRGEVESPLSVLVVVESLGSLIAIGCLSVRSRAIDGGLEVYR
jgi:hypothetical protein